MARQSLAGLKDAAGLQQTLQDQVPSTDIWAGLGDPSMKVGVMGTQLLKPGLKIALPGIKGRPDISDNIAADPYSGFNTNPDIPGNVDKFMAPGVDRATLINALRSAQQFAR